jgi:hypothetical protein
MNKRTEREEESEEVARGVRCNRGEKRKLRGAEGRMELEG